MIRQPSSVKKMKINILLSLISSVLPQATPESILLNTSEAEQKPPLGSESRSQPRSQSGSKILSDPIGKVDGFGNNEIPDENPATLVPFHDPSRKEQYMGYKDRKGNIVIPAKFRVTHPFNVYGFANISFQEFAHRYKINKKGEILYEMFSFDNGPDYVSQGMTRCVKDGKFGFADEVTGKVVISPRFDFAHPFHFSAPITLVCQGCKVVSKCSCSIKPGEPQSDFSKAKWGLIDKKGREITPCIFDTVEFGDENAKKVSPLVLFQGQKTYHLHQNAKGHYKLVEIKWDPAIHKKPGPIPPVPNPGNSSPAPTADPRPAPPGGTPLI
jgi:hypothetical protein